MTDDAKRLREAFDRAVAENPNFHERDRRQIVLLGAENWLEETVHLMHVRQVVDRILWSPPIPAFHPYEVMRVLTQFRPRR